MAYTYDELNRLSTVTVPGQSPTTYSYDEVGNLGGYTYPNGVATSYTYDKLNRLTDMSVRSATAPGGGPIASYTYTLGAAGNRTKVVELSGRTVEYGYDNLYRLKSETITGDLAGKNGVVGYSYDAVGNRKERTSTLEAVPASGLLYYDANDRTSTDTYDDNGNTVSQAGIDNAYDFENRLVKHGAMTFTYDGDGNRAAKTVGGVTTQFLVDTANPTGYAQVVDELTNGTVSRTYAYGLDLISQRLTTNDQRQFYGYDGHGSVRVLIDDSGVVTDTYDYDAFGSLINQTGSTPNNYLYAGEQYDWDLGLYYNRARYLDVRVGRFWGMDSWEGDISSPASLHRYLYASANPVGNIDPSGKFSQIETMIVASIANVLNSIEAPLPDAVKDEIRYGHGLAAFTIGVLGPSVLAGAFALTARFTAKLLNSSATRSTLQKVLPIIQKLCFAAGTPVHTKRGIVPIEEVRVGDEVLSRNMATGGLEYKAVKALATKKTSSLLEIGFSGIRETLLATPGHRFFSRHSGEKNADWHPASTMKPGDEVLSAAGEWIRVQSLEPREERTVYNFEVDENHNYYVGSTGILVHNDCNAIREIAEAAASKYGNRQCPECAEALIGAFRKNGISGAKIELKAVSPEAEMIFSEFHPSEAISDSGYHVAVEVDGIVFDNICQKGIARADWEASLMTRLGDFSKSFRVERTPF